MRKIRDVLRLSFGECLSRRQISASLGIPLSTLADCIGRARLAGLSWPLPDEMDDAALERALFPPTAPSSVSRPMPDWNYIHIELRKKAVTLQLLWIEYREQFPEGLGYSQFCNLYSAWRKKVDVVMRQHHRAGEKMFVDFPGMTIPIYDRTSQCGGPTHSISCNCGDPSQQVWWFEWLPWALTHGHNPMLTNAIWARLGGVNALSRSATALIGDCGFVFVFSAIMRAHSAKCRSSRRVRPGLGVAAIREYTSFASRDSGRGALQVWISSKSGPVRRSRGAVAGSPPSIPSRAIR